MTAGTPLHRGRPPRVVFAVYGFRPARNAGSVRTWNIAKYLARRGWDVTVLTPDPSLWRSVEERDAVEADVRAERIRRLATGHRWQPLVSDVLDYPDRGFRRLVGGACRRVARRLGVERTVGWIEPAVEACASLRPGDVDVVLASGPPFSTFQVARRLARRIECPYVLDYRDLWSRNLHHPNRRAASREARLLADCAAVTIVSDSWARVMDEEFGLGAKLHVISNGYDAEELAAVARQDLGHFAIVYAGVFYPPKRVVSPLFAALKRLGDRSNGPHKDWRFHYYGKDHLHVRAEAERFGITDRIVVHGDVPRADALTAVKGAGVTVVITSVVDEVSPEDNGMVTGKIFEAIGLGVPTLLIAPPSSDARAVARISGLARSFSANDADAMAAYLGDLLAGHSPQAKDPAAFAWQNLIDKFDRVLRDVTGR